MIRPTTEREARIADDARRMAFREAENWLRSKASKARKFPGGDDRAEMKGRADAYHNAAEHMRRVAQTD